MPQFWGTPTDEKGGSETPIEMYGGIRVRPPDIVGEGYFSEEFCRTPLRGEDVKGWCP